MLQQMSKAAAPTPQNQAAANEPLFEPLRVLQMALELDENSPGLWRALDALVAADQVAGVIELLGQMPDCDVARSLWARMRTPGFVQRLLDEAPYDQGLDSLVPYLPTPALAAVVRPAARVPGSPRPPDHVRPPAPRRAGRHAL